MSATLDEQLIKNFENSTIISIDVPVFPVEVTYLPNQPSILNQSLELKIKKALDEIPNSFDVLIFLPGMREILNIQSYLGDKYGSIAILHSEISKEEQEFALGPCSKRKIILASNIAESSITIPGIKAVIDSGIQREAHYSPWNGLKTIEDRPATKAAAIQRAGRAGRTHPGMAYRLYSKQDYESREDHQVPEIYKADLTDTFITTKQLNTNLIWPTPIPLDRWEKAQNLCYLLGLIDENDDITSLLEKTEKYPLDKKIARILLEGEGAKLSEKKKLLNFICETLERETSGKLRQRLSFYLNQEGDKNVTWEQCLLSGFIDQVAKYRSKQNDFIHFSGKIIKPHSGVKNLNEGFYLILNITQRQEALIVVAIEEDWLFEHTPFPFKDEEIITANPQFSLKSVTKLGSIVIDEKTSILKHSNLTEKIKSKLSETSQNFFTERWNDWTSTESYNRYHLWKKLNGDQELNTPDFWDYINFNGELNWDGLEDYFKSLTLDHELEDKLPSQLNVGGKRNLKVHYPYNQNPYLEAPIQEFYGLSETPKICQGKIVLILKLIGPHKRPLQVTSDLEGFWKKTYQEMLKEFKREYPRHYWPENPKEARPILLKRHLEES